MNSIDSIDNIDKKQKPEAIVSGFFMRVMLS